jgi:ABC-2 type transport system ATP-binding protein
VEEPAIETEGLSKSYGRSRALTDVGLRVERGEVFGFLGPNGAGKTTTIRLLLDLIRPTAGGARVLGLDCGSQSLEIRRRCGYVSGELRLPERPTGRHLLAHLARLRGEFREEAIEAIGEQLGLDLDRRIGELSKGNKQKVGIIAAFQHDPELLILDEPTSGLDPLRQHDVQQMVRDRASRGRTVFLSSHALDQVEHVADRVGFIRDGRLIAVEDVSALKDRAIRSVEVRFAAQAPRRGLADVEGVREATISGDRAELRVEGSMGPLIKALAQLNVVTMTSEEPDLDEIFLAYYGRDDEG